MLAITLCSIPTPTPPFLLPLKHIPTLSAPVIHGYNHRVPLWDRQCATSVIQYATDIEKALSEAATSEERYYQLCVKTSIRLARSWRRVGR